MKTIIISQRTQTTLSKVTKFISNLLHHCIICSNGNLYKLSTYKETPDIKFQDQQVVITGFGKYIETETLMTMQRYIVS